MPENDNFAVVQRLPSSLWNAEGRPKQIGSGMVADALALARKSEIALDVANAKSGSQEWLERHLQLPLLNHNPDAGSLRPRWKLRTSNNSWIWWPGGRK